MDFKLLGSILLIVGTSIGAGMLGLPIATAQLGFTGSLLLLFACWFVMTAGALLLLEVNLWLPQSSNLISMAKVTIGPIGQLIAWVTFLLLLYSLLCAYIAGGSDLLHNLLVASGITLKPWEASFLFTILFGTVVYFGIRSVDYVNRGLMFVKLGGYVLLVALLMPFISLDKLSMGNMNELTSITAITVTICSFGYATIVPSLRIYFGGNVRKLRTAIIIGGLIPLVCYIAWDAVIMGIISLQPDSSTSDLVNSLSGAVAKNSVTFFLKLFTSICVITSFLGVALCLADFWADGLQVEKKGVSSLFIHLLTFLPPLGIVLFFPNMFVQALAYGGVYSIILLILLPAWMAWKGRYHKKIANGYQVAGGKALLAFMVLFSVLMIVLGLK
ncbi:MAG: tryptophan/tyrosine permease [Gammaproteobacteria bacterium]|nr:MAG: tryptophan/tyrosine permease [Gammaproteobacteria bacterium]